MAGNTRLADFSLFNSDRHLQSLYRESGFNHLLTGLEGNFEDYRLEFRGCRITPQRVGEYPQYANSVPEQKKLLT